MADPAIAAHRRHAPQPGECHSRSMLPHQQLSFKRIGSPACSALDRYHGRFHLTEGGAEVEDCDFFWFHAYLSLKSSGMRGSQNFSSTL